MEEVGQAARHLLNKDNCGIALSNDAEEVGDEVAGVGGTASLAGDGKSLTRRAAEHEIHRATKSSRVEGSEITEDGSAVKESIRHPSQEHVLAERVDLAVGERPDRLAVDEVEPEVKAAQTAA